MRIGVLSDTHGLLRPEALVALAGVDHILHAGDVGGMAIFEALREIAPVIAIRGNIDVRGAVAELPATEAVELGGKLIYLVHSIADLDVKPESAGIALVISGHSHKPALAERSGVTYLNPGSAGPRRFKLPVTVAMVEIADGTLDCRIVELAISR